MSFIQRFWSKQICFNCIFIGMSDILFALAKKWDIFSIKEVDNSIQNS
jgi:hypothetical protein